MQWGHGSHGGKNLQEMLGLSGARQMCGCRTPLSWHSLEQSPGVCHPRARPPALGLCTGAPPHTSPAVVAVVPSGNAIGGAQVQAGVPAPHWCPGHHLPAAEIVVKGAVSEVLCEEKGQQLTQRLLDNAGPGPLQWAGLLPPLCKPSVTLPSWCGVDLGGFLPGQSTALPQQGRPSARPQGSSRGQGCSLH